MCINHLGAGQHSEALWQEYRKLCHRACKKVSMWCLGKTTETGKSLDSWYWIPYDICVTFSLHPLSRTVVSPIHSMWRMCGDKVRQNCEACLLLLLFFLFLHSKEFKNVWTFILTTTVMLCSYGALLDCKHVCNSGMWHHVV